MNAVSHALAGPVAEGEREDIEGLAARRPLFKPTELPLQRMLAAMMRANAEAQGQAQAKKIGRAQLDGMDKAQLTLKRDPNGGEPTVTAKNIPISMLNQTQGEEIEAAYSGPKEAVERELSGSAEPEAVPSRFASRRAQPSPSTGVPGDSAAASAAPVPSTPEAHERMFAANDKAAGERLPRPDEVERLMSTPEGVSRITYLLGGNEEHAKKYIRGMQDPKVRARQIARAREGVLALHHKRYEKIRPAIDDAQQDLDISRRDAAEKRMEDRTRINTIDDLIDNKITHLIGKSPDEALDTVGKLLEGGLRPGEREYVAAGLEDRRQAALKSHGGHVAKSIASIRLPELEGVDAENVDSYVDTKLAEIQAATPLPLSEVDRAQLRRTVAGMISVRNRKDEEARAETLRKEEAADRASQRLALTIESGQRATLEKADALALSVDELFSKVTDPGYKARNVMSAIETRRGHNRGELRKLNDDITAKVAKAQALEQGGPLTGKDRADLAGLQAELRIGVRRRKDLMAENEAIENFIGQTKGGQQTATTAKNAPPAARPASPAAAPAAAGPPAPIAPVKRRIGGGGFTYDKATEIGIAQVMKDHGLDRGKAIEALKKRGVIK